MGAQSKDFGAVSQTDLKGCISAVKFILFLIPVNARELRVLIRNETCETNRGWQNESQLFVKQNVSQALISVVTNNKNEFWKTVSLTSVQKSPMQSVSLFFKFVHLCFLLYLLCYLCPILTSWAVIFVSLNFVAVPSVWILVSLSKRRFWATHVNRKWSFFGRRFCPNFWTNRLYNSKDT